MIFQKFMQKLTVSLWCVTKMTHKQPQQQKEKQQNPRYPSPSAQKSFQNVSMTSLVSSFLYHPQNRQKFKIVSIATLSLFSIDIKNISVFLNLCIPQRESRLIFSPVHDVRTTSNTTCTWRSYNIYRWS